MLSILRRSSSLSFARSYAVAASSVEGLPIFKKLSEIVPREQARVKAMKTTHGEVQIGTCTVEQAYGGMRSVQSMIWETSLLDAQEGIRFRGFSIPELQAKLPKAVAGGEPLPEGLLYLMLTGELPTDKDVKDLSQELARRAALGRDAEAIVDGLPKSMHPMTQLTIGVLALQPQSVFAQAYSEGAHKNKLWHYALEDSLNLIAKLPALAARIFRNVYKNGKHIAPDSKLDWSANYARMLGFDKPAFAELMRLYLTLHADHEGGNVSAHATHLVGSTLSDPYYSFAGGMAGLAGPLHGLANQEVLNWTLEMQAAVGKTPSDADVEKYIWDTLNAGRVIPGFGHAVLRKTDPRYTAQREYSLKHLPNDPLFKLAGQLLEIVPKVLTKQGKVSNPWPNVDAHSGLILTHYGLTEQNYYTVCFGVSRALGVLSQYVWSRALGFPLERPKSITTEWLEKNIAKFQVKK